MIKENHLYLKLTRSAFRSDDFKQIFQDQLKLPPHKFPPQFSISDDHFFCGGYFVCYNKQVSPTEILKACRTQNWQFLVGLVADFLIVCVDFSKRKLYVLTDQIGKFPCFFSNTNTGENLILSTDFGLVKDALPSLTLDISGAFDYLNCGWVVSLDDKTIISEIKQVPPGTLLTVDQSLDCSLVSCVDIRSFLNQPIKKYTSSKVFADDFVVLLGQLVDEELKVLNGSVVAADLSSGFDSSLLCYLLKDKSPQLFSCYTWISKHIAEDTVPEIVRAFCQKHKLVSRFFPIDEFYPFSEFDLNWTKERFYPATHAIELEYKSFNVVGKEAGVLFQGIGGDEAYGSLFIDQMIRFPVQFGYFDSVASSAEHFHIGEVLTTKGVEILLDKGRFADRGYYPLLVFPSSIMAVRPYFSCYWEAGVWPMIPYIDPRLIQFARGIPHVGQKPPARQEIWKHRNDIFIPGQFRPKGDFGGLLRLFVEQRKDFIVTTLKNSLLGNKGWVKSEEILRAFKRGEEDKYQADCVNMYLHNLLRLEYFLQNNNIKIPDY